MTESEINYKLARLREEKRTALEPVKKRQQLLLDEYHALREELKAVAKKQDELSAKCRELEKEKRQVHNEILNTSRAYEAERDKLKIKLKEMAL